MVIWTLWIPSYYAMAGLDILTGIVSLSTVPVLFSVSKDFNQLLVEREALRKSVWELSDQLDAYHQDMPTGLRDLIDRLAALRASRTKEHYL